MAKNWYEHKDKTSLGYKMMFLTLKLFPSWVMRGMAFVIGFFYWLFDKKNRLISKDYLLRLEVALLSDFETSSKKKIPRSTLKHFCSFALNMVENVQSWAGKFSFKDVQWQNDDVKDLVDNINSGRGTVVVMSHLGNSQMMMGLASMGEAGTEKKMNVTSVIDTEITEGFRKLIEKVNPNANFHVINSHEIGPETIILMQERLENGEMIVVAGDRVSAHSDKVLTIPFLDEAAPFPYGVFLMIALLNSPTYFVTGLRHKDLMINPKYDMFVKKNSVDFDCSRKEREERILQAAHSYAENLERLCKMHPYQWYNFFDFWETSEITPISDEQISKNTMNEEQDFSEEE